MDPTIEELLRRLQSDYEAVMTAENPCSAAREWAHRIRNELSGPAWTEGPAPAGERAPMSNHAKALLTALEGIEMNGFWRPDSLAEFRAAAVELIE